MSYSQHGIQNFYDHFGNKEAQRLVATEVDEVSLFIHSEYLRKHIPSGSKVLEIGAGTGRFSKIIASITDQLIVTDISEVQLKLNMKYAKSGKYSDRILEWKIVDITELEEMPSSEFDVVVAYGGPLSYALERRFDAALEVSRILNNDGIFLLSVMSLFGSMHKNLNGILGVPFEINRTILDSGDITKKTLESRNGHYMHLFRSNELRILLESSNFEIISMSASNFLSTGWSAELKELKGSDKWNQFLEWELEACKEEGALDAGSHIIVVANKSSK
jgi:2-polyprenyl-3-methyl-5-hydroxy-6-metoxy-1,4-benzoquinol methylase